MDVLTETTSGQTNGYYLKEEILAVVVRECLRRLNNLVQIRIHELVNQIHVFEASPMDGQHHILQRNNILVPKIPKKLQLPQGSQRIDAVLERVVYLLYRDLLVGLSVHGGANDAVCPATDGFDGHVLGVDLEQGLPHGVVVLPRRSNPIRRLNRCCHSLIIDLSFTELTLKLTLNSFPNFPKTTVIQFPS